MFIALNIDAPEEIINVVEDVFEVNDPIETDQGFILEPIEIDEPTYETVEIEIEEIEIAEIEIAKLEIEAEIETEIEINEIEEPMEEIETIEEPIEKTVEEPTKEVEETTEESEPEVEETTEETTEEVEKVKEEPKEKEESKTETKKEEQKKESSKEKAVKKIMKKIDDKQRYDSANQMKTLIVMQVLGNSKSFFDSQKVLNDRLGFFTNATLPDTVISDNNIASYYLFAGSEGLMNDMIDSQWQTDLE
jgi:FtsZ-interacting cell division protein ZipA